MIASELYDLLQTAYLADTGSDGLMDSSSDSYVRNFFRMDDPNDRSTNWPLIRVEIIEQEGDSFSKDRVGAIVRFHVFTTLGEGFGKQNAVLAALRTLYHRKAVGSGVLWDFGEMSFRSGQQAPTSVSELHYVAPAVVNARRM